MSAYLDEDSADFIVTRHDSDGSLHVLLKYHEQGGLLGAQLIVEHVARHWRVVEFAGGPGLEGHEGYPSQNAAVEAAKGLLRAGDAARRLRGPPNGTVTGRLSSSTPNLQNLPRAGGKR